MRALYTAGIYVSINVTSYVVASRYYVTNFMFYVTNPILIVYCAVIVNPGSHVSQALVARACQLLVRASAQTYTVIIIGACVITPNHIKCLCFDFKECVY